MMLEFLRLLVYIRGEANSNYTKFVTTLSIISSSSFIFSILTDIYLPWNSLTMFLRCFLALILGISFAFLVYGMNEKKAQLLTLEDFEKENIRLKYSHNQRINISIMFISFLVLLHLLIIKQGSMIYTVGTSILIFSSVFLMIFIRPTKDEILRAKYGIEDYRDLDHDNTIREITSNQKNSEEKSDEEDTNK